MTTRVRPEEIPHWATLVQPGAAHHSAQSAGTGGKPLSWYKCIEPWSSDAHVSPTAMFSKALRMATHDLVAHARQKADGKQAYQRLHATAKLKYDLFSSKPNQVDHGNLLEKPAARSPSFCMTYASRPSHLILRLDNVCGELRVERPRDMRILVCARETETASMTTHSLQQMESVLCVRVEHRGTEAAPATELVTFNDPCRVNYAVQTYTDPANDAITKPLNGNANSLLSENYETLSVKHHCSVHGELDMNVAGNLAYTGTFSKASALVWIEINPLVTRVKLSNLMGHCAQIYLGFPAHNNNVNFYVATQPVAALSTNEGLAAAARALGITPYSADGLNLSGVLSDVHPLAELFGYEEAERKEASLKALKFDTVDGIFYLREDRLTLRTIDNMHYVAFLESHDVRSYIPLFGFLRRKETSSDALGALPPFKTHVIDARRAFTAIKPGLCDEEASRRSMCKFLDRFFGTPVYSIHTSVPMKPAARECVFVMLNELGCPIRSPVDPVVQPDATPTPAPPTPSTPATPAPPSFLNALRQIEVDDAKEHTPAPARESFDVDIALFGHIRINGRPLTLGKRSRSIPITTEVAASVPEPEVAPTARPAFVMPPPPPIPNLQAPQYIVPIIVPAPPVAAPLIPAAEEPQIAPSAHPKTASKKRAADAPVPNPRPSKQKRRSMPGILTEAEHLTMQQIVMAPPSVDHPVPVLPSQNDATYGFGSHSGPMDAHGTLDANGIGYDGMGMDNGNGLLDLPFTTDPYMNTFMDDAFSTL